LRNRQHFGFVLLDFVEADLMNLLRGQISRRGAANEELIVLRPVRKCRDAGLLAAGGNVRHFEKAREPLIGRKHLFADCAQHLRLDAFLFRGWY
jgi:hypothetical protein